MTPHYGANPNDPPPRRSPASVELLVGVGAAIVVAIIAATIVIVLARSDEPDNAPVAQTASSTTTPAHESTPPRGTIDQTTSTTAPTPESLVGTWSGTMDAPNGLFRQWLLTFTLSETPAVGSVIPLAPHPTLGCSGTATITEATGTTFVVQIKMQDDPLRRCAARASAKFALRADGQMDAAWQDLTVPINTATGVLTRQPQ